MGCAQSKIESEESVIRCKHRKQHMKQAVTHRNAFAAAHSSYAMALRNTGSALSDYGQSEIFPLHLSSSTTTTSSSVPNVTTQTSIDSLPPPPPPLPNFDPSPLLRSTSMPDLPLPRKPNPSSRTTTITEDEENDEEEEEEEEEHVDVPEEVGETSATPVPPPPLPPREQRTPSSPPPPNTESWDYFFSGISNYGDEIRPEKDEQGGGGVHYKFSKVAPGKVITKKEEVGGSGEKVEIRYSKVAPGKAVTRTVLPPEEVRMEDVGEVEIRYSKTAPSQSVLHSVPRMDSDEIPPPVEEVGEVEAELMPPPQPQMPIKKAVVAKGKTTMVPSAPNVNLLKMLDALDDHFLKASESAAVVSRMLESIRLHYHSNHADNRGHIDHSARVMKVITWNRSFKGIHNPDDANDDFDNEESETHATVLDKLLAWEKKLYDEVKAGELMKIQYQKKVAYLEKQKKQGKNPEALEKTKAIVSHLHTRYIVDMQSMDSTVSEVQRLRDHQLYPKLSELVDEMANMWEIMHRHHDSQLKIVMDLRSLDISCTPKETSEQHYQKTEQLYRFASEWHTHFVNLVTDQKEYIKALSDWLKLNIVPIESSLKERVSSPPSIRRPPIHELLLAWHDQLEKLPDGIARSAISSFAAVINAIMVQQQEEMKIKDSCEAARRELHRKQKHFGEWKKKHHIDFSELAALEASENPSQNAQLEEKKLDIENSTRHLEEEEERHRKMCKQVREKSIGSLKMQLPELFRAMADFSIACCEMYKNLRAITQMQNQAGRS